MKLLELLVKERMAWHPEALCYTQDADNMSVYPYKTEKPTLKGDFWRASGAISGHGVEISELADDWQTAIVTKEQYDNACKLVDDGYTLWFGGECPVHSREKVQVVLDGESLDGHDDFNRASDWRWEWEDGLTNIIAYKVAITKPDGSDEELSVVYEPSDLLSLHVPDVVNHPSHYTNGKVECIDAIESATVGKTGIEAVCVANVIKYLWRYEDKNGLEDIKKAQWYLNKLIEVKK